MKAIEARALLSNLGLGGKFGDRVVQVLQLEHAFDLTKYSLATLQSHFGDESGQWLYNICRGNDFREVRGSFA
jgi:nucleotidyltransferase/DNA polymerase involved in DNA repair